MNVSLIVATFGSQEWRDRGGAVLAAHADQADEAIAYHSLEGSLSRARNDAANQAKGEWLCFLDADDALAGDYLLQMRYRWSDVEARVRKRQRVPYADGPAALLVPAVSYVGEADPAPSIPAWGAPLIDINCAVVGTLVPRWLFTSLGGFREMDALEDWDLWLRAILAGAIFVSTPAAVYLANLAPIREGGRNADQSLYYQIRGENLATGFAWHDVDAYTL